MANNTSDHKTRDKGENPILAKNPNKFTVATLKETLRRRELSTQGAKLDLIKLLLGDDPTSQWMNETVEIQHGLPHHSAEATCGDDEGAENIVPEIPRADSAVSGHEAREFDLLLRERDLLARELALTR